MPLKHAVVRCLYWAMWDPPCAPERPSSAIVRQSWGLWPCLRTALLAPRLHGAILLSEARGTVLGVLR